MHIKAIGGNQPLNQPHNTMSEAHTRKGFKVTWFNTYAGKVMSNIYTLRIRGKTPEEQADRHIACLNELKWAKASTIKKEAHVSHIGRSTPISIQELGM